MTISLPDRTGTFHVDRRGVWTWSDDLYRIYGLAPGAVVPTAELAARHVHPEDRVEVERLLAESRATGAPSSLWHRLVTVEGKVRQVVMTSAGEFDGSGALVGVSGYVVDLTESVRLTTAREVEEAMEQMSHSRPLIEQAKGALMLTYAVDADTAFTLLRRYSQNVNVKVREVAQTLVEASAHRGAWPVDVRRALDVLAAELRVADAERELQNPPA